MRPRRCRCKVRLLGLWCGAWGAPCCSATYIAVHAATARDARPGLGRHACPKMAHGSSEAQQQCAHGWCTYTGQNCSLLSWRSHVYMAETGTCAWFRVCQQPSPSVSTSGWRPGWKTLQVRFSTYSLEMSPKAKIVILPGRMSTGLMACLVQLVQQHPCTCCAGCWRRSTHQSAWAGWWWRPPQVM